MSHDPDDLLGSEAEQLYVFDLAAWVHRYLAVGAENPGIAFVDFVRRIVDQRRPRFLAIADDIPGPTWRHDIFPEYKASRRRSPAEQVAVDAARDQARRELRRHCAALVGVPGFEADDVICSLVAKARARGLSTVIVALDKDLRQLVSHTTVVWDAKTKAWGLEDVRQEYGGLGPERLVDFFAIAGDPSDGVPGVRGLGHVAAIEILSRFDSLQAALEAAAGAGPDPCGLLTAKPRYRRLLVDHRADADVSRRLVALAEAPLPPLTQGDLSPRWALDA